MRKSILPSLILLLTLSLLLTSDSHSASRRYILRFPRQLLSAGLTSAITSQRGRITQSYLPPFSSDFWLEIETGRSTIWPRLLKKLQEHGISYASPSYSPTTAATPDDPYYLHGDQSYFKRLGIEQAWDKYAGSNRIKVAIIDTGISTNHPDLTNIFNNKKEIPFDYIDNDKNGYKDDLRGWDFINNDNDPDDDNGHGTHVAGLIGATTNNQIGIAGAAGGGLLIDGKPSTGVVLIPLKTASRNNQHDSNLVIAKAVDLAVNYGARIINLSLQTVAMPPITMDPLYLSLSHAAERGVVLIAAAGNSDNAESANLDNWYRFNLLANHPDVICVSATEVTGKGTLKIAEWLNSDRQKMYACYGSNIEVSAPGKNILSSVVPSKKKNPYDRYSGTSMATAIVSGAASLILSRNFRLDGSQVNRILQASATPLPVPGGGAGEINFARALMVTPTILEPFIPIKRQLLAGFPRDFYKKVGKIIDIPASEVDNITESRYYDLRLALLSAYYRENWASESSHSESPR